MFPSLLLNSVFFFLYFFMNFPLFFVYLYVFFQNIYILYDETKKNVLSRFMLEICNNLKL